MTACMNKRHGFDNTFRVISLVLILAFMLSASSICYADNISGDTSTDGAVITVVLFATVVTVLVILGMKADYDNVFGKNKLESPPVSDEEFMSRISVVLQRQEFEKGVQNMSAKGAETDVASDIGVGLRMAF